MLQVITVCHDATHAKPLIDSLCKHNWDFVAIECSWQGFGTKLLETYNYIKNHPEVDEFIFCDAFDVVCLGDESEFRSKLNEFFDTVEIVCSAEKGCWPISGLAENYPPSNSPFKYINSGCYYAISKAFMEVIEACMPDYESDDQLYLTERYLFDGAPIELDRFQMIFNSHSFIGEGEYTYENGRIQVLGSQPIFIHSNGRTVDPKLDEMLNKLK